MTLKLLHPGKINRPIQNSRQVVTAMKFKSRYSLFLLSSLLLSCDKSGSTSVEKPTSNPAGEADAQQLSIVDGRAWTLAQFSDFFDEDITIEDVKKAFGPNPQITSDGDQVKLTYVVESDRIYENGFRIHTIYVFFQKDRFLNVEIGFAQLSD